MQSEFGAKSNGQAGVGAAAVRGQQIHADSRHRSRIAAKVFRVYSPGRMVENPATGQVEPCLRDEVAEGKVGHWYDQGTVADSHPDEGPATAVVVNPPSRLRLLKEKILLRFKRWLP